MDHNKKSVTEITQENQGLLHNWEQVKPSTQSTNTPT